MKAYFAELGINVKDWDGLFHEMNQEGDNLAYVQFAENQAVIGFIQFKLIHLNDGYCGEVLCRKRLQKGCELPGKE
ncbi:MAG: hypothetical protein IJY09_08965 [Lachnospiraceae bacterium]|nr:hypothetical protein [Lachnospiraceae bacterium]